MWFQQHPALTRPDIGRGGVGANPLYNWAVPDTLAAWASGVAAAVQKGGFDGVMIDGYLTNCRSTANAGAGNGAQNTDIDNVASDGGTNTTGSPGGRHEGSSVGMARTASGHACPHVSGMSGNESHAYLRVRQRQHASIMLDCRSRSAESALNQRESTSQRAVGCAPT